MTHTRAVRREYALLAATYDRVWARYVDATTSLALAAFPATQSLRILDIGCGTGVLLQRALGADPSRIAIGVDVTHNMLLRARARLAPQVALVEASADALPMRAASVDLVVSTSALHYMDDPITVLREARRVLVPGGGIVVTDWCRDYWTMRALDRVLTWVDPAHVHTLRGDALVASLNSAGFSSARLTRTKIDAFWGIMTVIAVVRERAGT